jgi:hypothetical protein
VAVVFTAGRADQKSARTEKEEKGGETETGEEEVYCPSCVKGLRNGVECVVLRGCGHVICKEVYIYIFIFLSLLSCLISVGWRVFF